MLIVRGAPNEEVVKIVNIDAQILSEPVIISRAKNLKEALKNVAKVSHLWNRNAAIEVHQKFLESWALQILHNAAGLSAGDMPSKTRLSTIKNAVKELIMVMKPWSFKGTSDQNVRRSQYYWTLLDSIRSKGLPFTVAYRPASVYALLYMDTKIWIKREEIPAWVPTVQAVVEHVTTWFDGIEGKRSRAKLGSLWRLIRSPCRWIAPWDLKLWNLPSYDANASSNLLFPGSSLNFATYGYKGFLFRRKGRAIMAAPDTQKPVAVADIPEVCFLGVLPGTLKCSTFRKSDSIPALTPGTPKAHWLTSRLESEEEANTVLVWHSTAEPRFPL